MTVRVRSLIRVAGARTLPPIPPPVVTMSWRTEPTDTPAGGMFDPWVVVELSDHREGDLITVTNTCGGPSGEAITNVNGYAVFPGLSVGNTPAQGCQLIAHNVSRPEIAEAMSNPFDVLALVAPWELLSSASGYYNSGYAPLQFNTSGSTLIVLAWGTVDPPQLGFFTDALGNVGWQMATIGSLTMMWLLNPTNTADVHTFILQGINNATGTGMAFFGRNPTLISSANAFQLLVTSSIAAAPVAITSARQLVVTGLATGNVAPFNISDPIVGYVAKIQPPAIAVDGTGVNLHASGLGQKVPVQGTEEQPVWIGFPAGPMYTRTLLFEAGA